MARRDDLDALVFQCLRCKKRFTLRDLRRGRFHISTCICDGCYKQMQAQKSEVCCFGKSNKVVKGKVVSYGYDAKARECRSECPDRNICKVYVLRKTTS